MQDNETCPFCGSDVRVVVGALGKHATYTDALFHSTAECPECEYVGFDGEGNTEQEAIEDALSQWNKRVK